MYTPAFTKQFKRDYQKLSTSGRGVDDVGTLIRLLVYGKMLPAKLRDHLLKGKYRAFRECHVRPDLLIVYRIEGERLTLVRLGSHAELFE